VRAFHGRADRKDFLLWFPVIAASAERPGSSELDQRATPLHYLLDGKELRAVLVTVIEINHPEQRQRFPHSRIV
jgi:hypothetical protein